jgi:hypothetical protein
MTLTVGGSRALKLLVEDVFTLPAPSQQVTFHACVFSSLIFTERFTIVALGDTILERFTMPSNDRLQYNVRA